jgi:hypothetical protein
MVEVRRKSEIGLLSARPMIPTERERERGIWNPRSGLPAHALGVLHGAQPCRAVFLFHRSATPKEQRLRPPVGHRALAMLWLMEATLYCIAVLCTTTPQPLIAQGAGGGGPMTTVEGVLLHTENLLCTVRSNMTGEIRQCLDKPLPTTNALVQLRNAIMQLQEELLRAGIGLQLSNAQRRVEAALAAADSKSTNLDDRIAFLGHLNVQDFRSRIEAQEAEEASLRRDLDYGVQALTTSLEVVTPLQDILTDAELSTRIANRLRTLLDELEKSGTEAEPKPPETGKGDKKAIRLRPLNDDLPGNISPSVGKVIRMARARVEDRAILAFIASSSTPFGLNTVDQIIAARQEGLSDKVLCGMLERDRFLRSKAATKEAVRP